jgi:hypothetical protein
MELRIGEDNVARRETLREQAAGRGSHDCDPKRRDLDAAGMLILGLPLRQVPNSERVFSLRPLPPRGEGG